MTHHKTLTLTLTLTLGSALAAPFAAAPIANAADNPFALKAIDGMQQVAEVAKKAKEGKCGEGKCAANQEEGRGLQRPQDEGRRVQWRQDERRRVQRQQDGGRRL